MATSLLALLALVAPLALSLIRNGDTTGPILVLGHLADLGAALSILAISAAIGVALLRRFPGGIGSSLELLPFSVALGAGVLAPGILAAVALAGVRRWVLGALLTGLVIVLRRPLREVAAHLRPALTDLLEKAHSGRSRFVLLGCGVAAAFLLCMAVAPPSDWDSMMYHVEIPIEWLRAGRIFVPGGNDHTAFIGIPQLLYLPLLATGSLAAPAILSVLLTLVLALSVFAISARFWKPPTQNYVLAAFWGSPAVLLVGMTARVDVTLTLYTLLAQYALLRAWLDRPEQPWLELGAMLLGFAFGVKYQGGLYAIALLPLVILACVRRCGGVAGAWRPLLRFGVISALAASPWLLKNWFLFHAPFYPFLSEPAHPDWLASIPASISSGPRLDPRVQQILQRARAPFNLLYAFLAPSRLSVEAEAHFYYLRPVLVLLPLWIFRWRDRVINGLGGPAVLYLVFLLSISPETNLRYLIPAFVPLTLVTTALAIEFSQRISVGVRAVARTFLVLVTVFPAALAMAVWISGTSSLSHLVGATSGNAYRRTHLLPEVRAHARVAEFANRAIPPSGRLLMIFEARGLYLRPAVIEDTRLTNWALLASRLGPGQCLSNSGITHVLVNGGAAEFYVERGVPPDVLRWDEFERFAARCLTPIYADSGLTLYRVGNSR